MMPSDSDEEAGHSEGPGGTVIHTNEHLILTPPGRRPGYWLRRFAIASVVATFALIVLGGIVRVTGSGLGCGGEWPLCDGSLIPPLTKEDLIEYSHRLVASGIVGPLVAITFLIALVKYRKERSVLIPSAISVVLLLAQAGLGGVTVLTELPGHVVAAHMALAQALLACLILVAVATFKIMPAEQAPALNNSVELREHPATPPDRAVTPSPGAEASRFALLAAVTALLTYAVLLSGSYVTATPGALAACPQWPLCDGSFWPSGALQTIHMLHRIMAAAVGVLILYTAFRGYQLGRARIFREGIVLMVLSCAGGIAFLTQVFFGAVAIWTSFPVSVRAFHIGLATAVWGLMVGIALVSRLREPDSRIVLQNTYAIPGAAPASPGQEQA